MNIGKGSTLRIEDDLTNIDISRQRKYQIRNMRKGLCIICGEQAHSDTLFCLEHNHSRGIMRPGRNKQRVSIWRLPHAAHGSWTQA